MNVNVWLRSKCMYDLSLGLNGLLI
jgi:hypothetical protein